MGQMIRITKAEFLRLLKNKATYIIMLLHIISILLLFVDYIHKQISLKMHFGFEYVASGTNEYIYRPFVIGTLTGSVLWGIFYLILTSKVKKNGTKEMIAAFMDERKHSLTRVLAFILLMIIETIICMAVLLPICMKKMDYLFSLKVYITYPLILMLPGLIMTVFVLEGLYRIFENTGVSLFIFALLTGVRFTSFFVRSPFTSWNFPQEYEVSDTVGSPGTVRIQIYTRIILLFISIGIWSLSVLFTRKYQYGPVKSFIVSLRKPLRLTVPVITIAIAVTMIVRQPFIDNGPIVVFDNSFFEMSEELTAKCSDVEKDFYFDTTKGTVKGTYKLNITELAKTDLEIHHNSGLKIKKLTFNGEDVDHTTEYKKDNANMTSMSFVYSRFHLPENSKGELICEFEGYPTQSKTFYKQEGYSCALRSVGRDYIYMQFDIIGMYGIAANPQNIKVYFNAPADHNPIKDGYEMKKIGDNDDGTVRWMTNDEYGGVMSASNKIIDIDYDKADVKLEYNTKNDVAVKDNKLDKAVTDVLDYCDEHIGELDSDEAGRVSIELVSSELGGGFAAGGNAVIDESVLSADNLSDSKDGANSNEVFMHEIVHLFLGDLGLSFEDDGLWSCEGMTVYTTYRIVKEKYGELYANKYYVDVWKNTIKKQNNNFYLRHPEYLDKLPENFKAGILNSIKTDNKYCRMPLMLLKAEEKLGEEKMDEVIKELYSRKEEYLLNGTSCTYQDFLETAGLSKEDMELE